MNRFILASHGDLAMGMKKTIAMLFGVQDNISSYGLQEGESVKELFQVIEKEVLENPEDTVIAITDLPGGSVNNHLLELVGKRQNFYLLSGMNAGLVLNLVIQQEITEKVIVECIEGAKGTIQYFSPEAMMAVKIDDEGGDFFD